MSRMNCKHGIGSCTRSFLPTMAARVSARMIESLLLVSLRENKHEFACRRA